MIKNEKFRLFLLSFLVLFLELVLIRYIPSNIRLISFFSNLILIGTFLGLGSGILLARRHTEFIFYFPILTKTLDGNEITCHSQSYMKSLYKLFPLLSAFFLGVIATTGIVNMANAHGGSSNFIHACVRTSNGSIKIVSASDNCGSGETSLDWSKIPWNTDFPMMCQNCNLTAVDVGSLFYGKDLSNAFLNASDFQGVDFSNTIFTGAQLRGIHAHDTNFTGRDLSDIDMEAAELNNANFSNTTLTNVILHGGSAIATNFTGANLQNAIFTEVNANNAVFTNANLENVNFSIANLTGATDLSTATRTGITWSNTTCPDGTNSDNNGNTCEGHLTP